jgi:hypothetical protein
MPLPSGEIDLAATCNQRSVLKSYAAIYPISGIVRYKCIKLAQTTVLPAMIRSTAISSRNRMAV